MKSASVKTAVCGVTGALAIVFMLGGVLFPFATFACPAAAAWLLLPVCYEYGAKTAFVMYRAVGRLSLFLLPDSECSFTYIFIFGLYTVIKFSVDRMKSKTVALAVKLCYINFMTAAMYRLLILLFPTVPSVSEIFDYTPVFALGLMAMMNAAFFLYDKAAEKVLIIYVRRFRGKIFRT